MEVGTDTGRKKLATLWYVWVGILFLLFFVQSLFGQYGKDLKEVSAAWGWFLPTIMPTLSLITGILILEASRKRARETTVDRFFFRITFGFSIAYLLVVTLTILLEPVVPLEISQRDFMQVANLGLAPFQGLVSGLLGIFFVRAKKT